MDPCSGPRDPLPEIRVTYLNLNFQGTPLVETFLLLVVQFISPVVSFYKLAMVQVLPPMVTFQKSDQFSRLTAEGSGP